MKQVNPRWVETTPLRLVSLLIAALIFGCSAGGEGASEASEGGSTGGARADEPAVDGLETEVTFDFNFEDTPLHEVVRVLLEAETDLVLSLPSPVMCLRISVSNVDPVRFDEALAQVRSACAELGVNTEHTGNEIVFSLADGVTLPSCDIGTRQMENLRSPSPAPVSDEIVAQIRNGIRVHGQERIITRAARDLLRDHSDSLFAGVHIEPVSNSGRIESVRVSGVEAGGVSAVLGFMNDDQVLRVNGFDVGNVAGVLEAFSGRWSAETMRFDLLRNGMPVLLEFRLVEATSP